MNYNGCKFCDQSSPYHTIFQDKDGSFYWSIRTMEWDDWADQWVSLKKHINYCPFCGKELDPTRKYKEDKDALTFEQVLAKIDQTDPFYAIPVMVRCDAPQCSGAHDIWLDNYTVFSEDDGYKIEDNEYGLSMKDLISQYSYKPTIFPGGLVVWLANAPWVVKENNNEKKITE